MQISLKLIQGINHAKSTVFIKSQLLVTFNSLFTGSSSSSVFPRGVLYIGRRERKGEFSYIRGERVGSEIHLHPGKNELNYRLIKIAQRQKTKDGRKTHLRKGDEDGTTARAMMSTRM